MKASLTRVLVLIAVLCGLASLSGAAATTTFRFSSVGGGDTMVGAATGWGDYTSISVYEQGVGSYGVLQTPDGVRGGWSTRGSSGGFGYRTDMDGDYSNGNQGGFTTLAVNSRNGRGSYVDGYGSGGYGSFTVGSSRFTADPYYTGRGGAWGAYPANIPYMGYGGWSNGYGGGYGNSFAGSYSYGQRGWY